MEDKENKQKYGNCPITDSIEDYIGPYGTPNTYTANLPENERKKYSRPDMTQRVTHVNPNNFDY